MATLINADPKLFVVGTFVKSHYRASWKGIVVASGCDHTNSDRYSVWVNQENQKVEGTGPNCPAWPLRFGQVVVKVTHDRSGKVFPKPLLKHIGTGWLEIISSPKEL